MDSRKDRDLYYNAAASWSQDAQARLHASRRVAWIIAAAAVAIAVLEAIALAALAPLKTVTPYAIVVDRRTGYAEVARELRPGGLSQSAAVTQAMLAQYVVARETFDAADLDQAYRKVILMSAGAARESYRQGLSKSNPASPLNLYPAAALVSTSIESVSLISPSTALVRFSRTRSDSGGPPISLGVWSAVIGYRWSDAPMTMADRLINPLGFQATSYRKDAEIAAPVGQMGALR